MSDCIGIWQIIIGALGAAATIALGIISLWQNRRYKKLSDEMNDRTIMPTFYPLKDGEIDYVVNDDLSEEYELQVYPSANDETLYSIHFATLNLPVVGLNVLSLICDGEKYEAFNAQQPISVYRNNTQFCACVAIPDEHLPTDQKPVTSCEMQLCYKNIYMDHYTCNVYFNLEYGHFDCSTDIKVIDIKIDKSKRYNNGQA
jgi:hypothetical protein